MNIEGQGCDGVGFAASLARRVLVDEHAVRLAAEHVIQLGLLALNQILRDHLFRIVLLNNVNDPSHDKAYENTAALLVCIQGFCLLVSLHDPAQEEDAHE